MNSMRSLTAIALLAGFASFATGQVCPPGATIEGEEDCGLPDDTTNGGCNSVVPVFGSISDGETICGTSAFDDLLGSRDTDWFEFVLTETSEVTLTTYTEFDALVGFVESDGNPGCGGVTGFISPASFPLGFDAPTDTVAILPAGTYYIFVAPTFDFPVACGTPYTATLNVEPFVATPPTEFIDLGEIGLTCPAIDLNLCASDFDTELGVWDNDGNLVASNDDFCGLQSGLVLGLAEGTYWASVSGFNTDFSNFWLATPTGSAPGNYAGSFGSAAVSGFSDVDAVQFYRFEVGAGTAVAPSATDLGDIATDADTFSIDTFGSDFDTELGLWDSEGFLLADNDDAGGGLQSELAGLMLAEGTYYMSISGFNTTFSGCFGASTSSTAVGTVIGLANATTIGPVAIAPGEIQFYSFNVTGDGGGSCPGDIADDNGTPGADGQVSFGDFLFLLGVLGPCP